MPTTYLVTGATGFLGGQLLAVLLARDDVAGAGPRAVELAVEAGRRKLRRLPGSHDDVVPLVGDLVAADPRASTTPGSSSSPGTVDHLVHLAAVYDMTADDDANEAANVDGTRHVVELANRLGRAAACTTCRRSPSPASTRAGSPRTCSTRASTCRRRTTARSSRPSASCASEADGAVAGVPAGDRGRHSQTGEIDKIDGPYYLFEAIRRLSRAPGLAAAARRPTSAPPTSCRSTTWSTRWTTCMHAEGLDGRAFHLVNPTPAAGAPRCSTRSPRPPARRRSCPPIDRRGVDAAGSIGSACSAAIPGVELGRDVALDQLGIPLEVLPHVAFPRTFDDAATEAALTGTGIEVPRPAAATPPCCGATGRRTSTATGPAGRRPGGKLAGRRVVITGASSGIGRATALQVARHGGVPILVARRAEALEELRKPRSSGRRPGVGVLVRHHRRRVGRRAGEAAARRPRRHRHAREQRRPVDPPVDQAVLRPLPRLRAHDGAQLLRRRPADPRAAAAHDRAAVRPHRERVVDRRAGQPAAVLRLRGVEGGARRVQPHRGHRDLRRRRHVHHDPHAARAHADDRPDHALRRLPHDQPRRGRRAW